jgi:O-methyltransferase
LTIHHCIDAVYSGRATGWAFAPKATRGAAEPEPLSIEARHEGACLGRTVANLPRPDVGDAYSAFKNSGASGFDLEFELPNGARESAEVTFHAVASAPGAITPPYLIGTARVLTRRGFDAAVGVKENDDLEIPFAPIPRALARIVGWLSPDGGKTLGLDHHTELADKIASIVQGPESSQLPGIVPYLRFLRMTWAHFQFVSRYFPNINHSVPVGSKDRYSKQNSAEEMFSIAHHLFVLKSFGVTGDFAEFGCFKGFSSSMLSYACQLLGIRMHIFDSFEGLPPSTSSYYSAGDFRGDFEEVKHNVERFGAASAVTYHKGFFSDSIPVSNLPQLIALWMDVDLKSSSADVMSIADKVHPHGAIFSHECEPKNFVNGEVVASSDSVIPPIVDRFRKLGAHLTGRFLSGNTGAFWRGDRAIPVLSAEALTRLIHQI